VLFFYEKYIQNRAKHFQIRTWPTVMDVIRRLCNKDRDQGTKGIGVIGIDHVVTYSTLDK